MSLNMCFRRLGATPLRVALRSHPRRGFAALSLDKMNSRVLDAQYAVRGRLVLRAGEISDELANNPSGHGHPFDEVIFCNIGNPHALMQSPLSFHRQVLSLCMNPSLVDPENLELTRKLYPDDVIERAKFCIEETPGGFGSYTHSMGLPWIRKNIARFIEDRDNVPADPDQIFLTNGASEGIARVMRILLRDEKDGILVPVPQYPLYSATLALEGGRKIDYILDEDNNWESTAEYLESAVEDALAEGTVPRGLVVINPGNPTGQVLSRQAMEDVIRVCKKYDLALLADEVYQANAYHSNKPFLSFKKVLAEMDQNEVGDVELFSFHSTSKGFLGECGMRGGYTELVNIDPEVTAQLYKLSSVGLCSGAPGQLMTDLMVAPPKEGDASYELYVQERDGILNSLSKRAKKMAHAMNQMEGVTCNEAEGALYVFPQIRLPEKVLALAAEKGIAADLFYAEELLNKTGICVVPGSGFGQVDGTWHFRTTILPSEGQIDQVIDRMGKFHADFMQQHR